MFETLSHLTIKFDKLLSRINSYVENHAATKDRPKLFQIVVLLILIIVVSFVVSQAKHFGLHSA